MSTESLGKSRYVITFIDNATRWCEVYFIRHKSEALEKFKEYNAMMENKSGRKIKYLQTDNGTEYINREFENYLRTNGIQRRLSVPYCPAQNGIAERKNRTLLETARCLLIQAGLPTRFWAEAMLTANYIRNRCPSRSINQKSPFEMWYQKSPSLRHFQEFGSRGFVLNKKPHKGKFDPRSEECIFVGYATNAKGHRLYLPKRNTISIARDVKLLDTFCHAEAETSDFFPKYASDQEIVVSSTPIQLEDKCDNQIGNPEDTYESDKDSEQEEPNTLRRGPGRPKIIRTGSRGRPSKKYHMVNETIEMASHEFMDENIEFAFNAEIPIKDALQVPFAEEWMHEIANEIKSIISKGTWNLVDRPEETHIIGSRFVLRNKFDDKGNIERRKARLVARGFAQRPGLEFDATFSPVVRMETIRILIALAAMYRIEVEQLDVTTAY